MTASAADVVNLNGMSTLFANSLSTILANGKSVFNNSLKDVCQETHLTKWFSMLAFLIIWKKCWIVCKRFAKFAISLSVKKENLWGN